jgi:hypothetical protein
VVRYALGKSRSASANLMGPGKGALTPTPCWIPELMKLSSQMDAVMNTLHVSLQRTCMHNVTPRETSYTLWTALLITRKMVIPSSVMICTSSMEATRKSERQPKVGTCELNGKMEQQVGSASRTSRREILLSLLNTRWART